MVGLFTSCVEIREEQAYIVKCQPRYESYAMLFFLSAVDYPFRYISDVWTHDVCTP